MYVYNVDGWRVVASNPHEAKYKLGQYHDLPRTWYEVLQAVFIGRKDRVQLTGKEIA